MTSNNLSREDLPLEIGKYSDEFIEVRTAKGKALRHFYISTGTTGWYTGIDLGETNAKIEAKEYAISITKDILRPERVQHRKAKDLCDRLSGKLHNIDVKDLCDRLSGKLHNIDVKRRRTMSTLNKVRDELTEEIEEIMAYISKTPEDYLYSILQTLDEREKTLNRILEIIEEGQTQLEELENYNV
jgi:hypothetical protein